MRGQALAQLGQQPPGLGHGQQEIGHRFAGHDPAVAPAQDYPNKPITMVVPFAAGGTTDVIARFIADALRGPLGQPVIIDNRGGAGGNT